jgi:riboflavin biosynthesis pyrimidine reductase
MVATLSEEPRRVRSLVKFLIEANLLDELRLMVFPVLLGEGNGPACMHVLR